MRSPNPRQSSECWASSRWRWRWPATHQRRRLRAVLRGAVRDANGVIPGVTVQIVNEATGQTREAVSNDQGEYNFAAVPPGTYTVKATLTGFRTYENKSSGSARSSSSPWISRSRSASSRRPLRSPGSRRLSTRQTRRPAAVIDSQQLPTLPSGGRSAFLFAVTVPTVVASGDSQFNRQQDQTNASLLSLGGGTRRGNNYLVDGVPITDMRNRASANPSIEAIEDVAVQVHHYDAETGAHRRRHVQRRDQVRHERLARQRLLSEPAEVGRGEQLLLRAGGVA